MNILLINTNPVVSRLLALCTRDDTLSLHEISLPTEVVEQNYDIIFVDEASHSDDVSGLLLKFPRAKKIVLSYKNDAIENFDVTIKKPFLPSQITNIIQGTLPENKLEETFVRLEADEILQAKEEEASEIEGTMLSQENPTIFPLTTEEETLETTVLDANEIEKIKSLLDMNEESLDSEEILSDEALEARKIEVIKEQLIAEGLEIVDEHKIVEELSISLDGTLKKNLKEKHKKKKKHKKSKKIKFTEENMEHIEDAVEMAIAHMTKKQMKQLLKGKEIKLSVKLPELD